MEYRDVISVLGTMNHSLNPIPKSFVPTSDRPSARIGFSMVAFLPPSTRGSRNATAIQRFPPSFARPLLQGPPLLCSLHIRDLSPYHHCCEKHVTVKSEILPIGALVCTHRQRRRHNKKQQTTAGDSSQPKRIAVATECAEQNEMW